MRRASKLSTPEDFAIEERREGIRDARTRRAMNMILCVSLALSLSSFDDDLTRFISNLVHTFAGA